MTVVTNIRKTFRARQLRNQQTEAERKLWSLLRNRQFEGLKFRRQQPIGPYIADFYCSRARLIIELDGGQHQEQKDYDQIRTNFLEQAGYVVLRFWNNDLLSNPEGVASVIQSVCTPKRAPSPLPSPQKGEGDKGWRPYI